MLEVRFMNQAKGYLGPCQTSMMEIFAKIVSLELFLKASRPSTFIVNNKNSRAKLLKYLSLALNKFHTFTNINPTNT